MDTIVRQERRVRLVFGWVCLMLGQAACNHEAPFQQPVFGSDTTRTRGTDRQLTYNIGNDRTPAWLPDGSGMVFMYEDLVRADNDRCLARLPATGGSIDQLTCRSSFGSLDSIDTFFEPAPAADGQLLYLRESSVSTSLTPTFSALMLGTVVAPEQAAQLRIYPYTASSGSIHQGISNIRWLTATTAVYLGERVLYRPPCQGCSPDTVRIGIEIVKLDLSGPAPVLTPLPNTLESSSVAAGTSGDDIYFTRNGDSRVYQMTVSTGAVSIIHDFGSLGIARDVQVSGVRMIAVVGGEVAYFNDPALGQIQVDNAGALWEVNLTTGSETPLPIPGRFVRRPALSPEGSTVVAESFILQINSCGPTCLDTLVVKTGDLWLVELP